MGSSLRRVLVVMLFGICLYGAFAVWRGIGSIGESLSHFPWWAFAAGLRAGLRQLLPPLPQVGVLPGAPRDPCASRGSGPARTCRRKSDSFLTFLSGFVLTVTPGKVGEVFKSLVLFETHGVPIARTAPIVVAERVTDLIGVIILIVLGSLGFSGGLVWAGVGATLVRRSSSSSPPGGCRSRSSGSSSGCRGASGSSARSSTRRTRASRRC